jgi:hypothetical protein
MDFQVLFPQVYAGAMQVKTFIYKIATLYSPFPPLHQSFNTIVFFDNYGALLIRRHHYIVYP